MSKLGTKSIAYKKFFAFSSLYFFIAFSQKTFFKLFIQKPLGHKKPYLPSHFSNLNEFFFLSCLCRSAVDVRHTFNSKKVVSLFLCCLPVNFSRMPSFHYFFLYNASVFYHRCCPYQLQPFQKFSKEEKYVAKQTDK